MEPFNIPEDILKNDFFVGDYYSDKIIIMYYPPGAGGFFLNNCLYLSNDINCEQVSNIQEKLELLIYKTKSLDIIWDDVFLKSSDFSGKQYNFLLNHPTPSLKKALKRDLEFWVNCKTIIYFKNTKLFRYLRSCNLNESDIFEKKKIKTSLLQFINHTEDQKNGLIKYFNDRDQLNSYCSLKKNRLFYVWDTNWYFSLDQTLNHIEELYKILNLSGFDSNNITQYYNVWMHKMDELKLKTLEKFK